MLNLNSQNLSIQLPDGRKLGYAEYGAPTGEVVLYFHAAPGASHLSSSMASEASKLNVHLIAIDRPGYGFSAAHSGRTFLSWADDVAALMDSLRITRFSIVGFSGGCPFALACAFKLAARVKKVALVAPLIPGVTTGMPAMVAGLYALAQSNPDELRATFASVAPSAAALGAVIASTASERDKKILNDYAAEFEAEWTQALLAGIEGVASDYILFAGEFGFSIAELKTEVDLYSGALDENTPPAMALSLAAQLPNSHVHVLQDEGHFVLPSYWERILQNVIT